MTGNKIQGCICSDLLVHLERLVFTKSGSVKRQE